ncbi:RapZ C-terminal domain-containing protein [Streptomyces sp. NPDC003042]
MLDLDGLNPRVQYVVLATPGARELLADLPAGPRRIAIGCAGGRHRASGLAELLARALRERGREVEVEHLHVHLPRVLKTFTVTHAAHSEQETADDPSCVPPLRYGARQCPLPRGPGCR